MVARRQLLAVPVALQYVPSRVYKSVEKSAVLCLHDAALAYPLGWPVGLDLCSTILTAVLKCLNLENLSNFQFLTRGMVSQPPQVFTSTVLGMVQEVSNP